MTDWKARCGPCERDMDPVRRGQEIVYQCPACKAWTRKDATRP